MGKTIGKTLGKISEHIAPKITDNLCPQCHETIQHALKKCIFCDTLGAFLCHLCKKSIPKLQNIHIAFQYESAIKTIIQQLKFSLKPYLAVTISQLVWQHHRAFFEALPQNTTIIPMPSGRFRVAQRGYNPAALIAQQLAKQGRFHYCDQYLLKSAFSIPQTELSRQERLYNLSQHFWLNPKPQKHPPQSSILLIDDVITTGRSFEKAAEMLNDPQTKQLFGLFIAQS